MNGGDGALFGVDEEDGDAVGGLHAEEKAGTVGDGGVAMAGFGRGSIEQMDYVGVDLFEGDKFQVRGSEGELEAAAVFQDVFLGVPFGET